MDYISTNSYLTIYPEVYLQFYLDSGHVYKYYINDDAVIVIVIVILYYYTSPAPALFFNYHGQIVSVRYILTVVSCPVPPMTCCITKSTLWCWSDHRQRTTVPMTCNNY